MYADEENHKAPQVMLLGQPFDRLPYKSQSPDEYCTDCGVAPGRIHDLCCDTEDCPRCGGQLIGCGCLPDPDDE